MTQPTVRSSDTSVETGNTTTHSVLLPPTVASGDLLLAFFSCDGAPTVTWDNSTAGTWTVQVDTAGPSSANKLVIYAKVADGTEDGLTLSVSTGASSEQSVHRTLAIQDWEGTLSGGLNVPTAATGTSTTPDPPAATDSWGTVDRKTIAVMGNDFSRTVSAYPSGYTLNQFNDTSGGGAGCGLGSAGRNGNEGSQNPGTFTIDSSDQWVAATISIQGSSATTASGDLSTEGASTATLRGSSRAASRLSAAGASTATLRGATHAASRLSAAGAATANLVGSKRQLAVLTTAGASTAILRGSTRQSAVLSAAGASTATLQGSKRQSAVLTTAGAATATLAARTNAASDLSATGAATATLDTPAVSIAAIVVSTSTIQPGMSHA